MKFFSTDGIRGHEKELISNDIVFNLGSIIGSKSKRILLGQDTRKSSSFSLFSHLGLALMVA